MGEWIKSKPSKTNILVKPLSPCERVGRSRVFKGCLRGVPLEGISHVKGNNRVKQLKDQGLVCE